MPKREKQSRQARRPVTEADDVGLWARPAPPPGPLHYARALRELQIELVKLQRDCCIAKGQRIVVIFEGRDAAGKDGTIKRIVEHLSPRDVRVVALGKPSDREITNWYFQRWVAHLPAAGEMVFFNRSWYNRAGVEYVMGFCTPAEHKEFLSAVPRFEEMLINSGIIFLKYYLDITKDEQRRRLKDRTVNPLKQWKTSPIDAQALKYWDAYSSARDEMLTDTHTTWAPWTVVHANDKRITRLNVVRDLLDRIPYEGKRQELVTPEASAVAQFDPRYVTAGALAK